MTRPAMSRWNAGALAVTGGRRTTIDLPWQTRVVIRRKTGSCHCSDSSNAARRRSYASCESDGSSIGSPAATA